MKILVDCSLLNIGGGVQVGLSFLENLSNDKSIEAIVVATVQIDQQLSDKDKLAFKNYQVIQSKNKIKLSKIMKKIEAIYNPDLVFTVFGPSYWRSKAPNLQGFALGLMFYSEVQDYLKYSFLKKIRIKLMYIVKQYLFKKNADYYVVETNVVRKNLSKLLNVSLDNIFVVENCYSPIFEKNIKENNISNNKDKFNLIVPSSYYPHKNLEVVAVVCDILVERKIFDINFNFMLKKSDFDKIKSLCKNQEAKNLLNNYGPVDYKMLAIKYLENNAVFLPTLAESSTSAYPEAFISKRPLLTSDRDFAHGLCKEAAIYFDPFNAIDIVEKIISLKENENLKKLLIANGLHQLSTYTTPETKWLKQREIFHNILNIHEGKQDELH